MSTRNRQNDLGNEDDAKLPRVSVLMPVYNAEKYVSDSIQSVLCQTYRNFELLVTDDGSNDRSAERVRQIACHDARVKFSTQTNRGCAATLADLLDSAVGEYVARLDADDLALPDRFSEQVAYLDSHLDCDLVGSAVICIDSDGSPYGVSEYPLAHENIIQQMLAGQGGIVHPSILARTDTLRAAGGFAVDLPGVEDQDLWFRVARIGRLHNLETPLTKYRVHAANVTFTHEELGRRSLEQLLRREYRLRGLAIDPKTALAAQSEWSHKSRRWRLWNRKRQWACTAVDQGNLATARKHARSLFLQNPIAPAGWRLAARAYFPNATAAIRRILRWQLSD